MCTGEHVRNSCFILSNSSVQKEQSNKQKVFKATRTIQIFLKNVGGNSLLIVEIPLFLFLVFSIWFYSSFFSSYAHADTYWQPHMHSRHVPHVQSHSRLRISRQENRIQNWSDELGTKNKPAAALKKNHMAFILWSIALLNGYFICADLNSMTTYEND